MSKRLYLAGPMRGFPDANFPAFHAAAAALRNQLYEVYNPAEHENFDGTFKPLAEYMIHDLPEVCRSDGIVLLPGWLASSGACLEYFVADYLGKPAYEFVNGLLRHLQRKPFAVALQTALTVERLGLGKHKLDSWRSEPRQNHTLKASRHLMTHELIQIGWAEEDGEDHLGNALCRVAMALAQEEDHAIPDPVPSGDGL